ncbi:MULTISPECIES: hypothetical protein [unclassified Sphingomonas]|uniref:hypothetical protein n=1 Tax=unclassified Sphingomonas TaxID=196159 RepID=UPI0012E2834A|nr:MULTISPECIES: hypothetical protein [unclassified Sphingomonas]
MPSGGAQRPAGFLTQSAFTGLAQALSCLVPPLLMWWGPDKDAVDANGIPDVTRTAFIVGAILSLPTILWSVLRVPGLPVRDRDTAPMVCDVRLLAVHRLRARPVAARHQRCG